MTEIRKYWPFLVALVKRDVKKKYYRSVLGALWTILNPICMMIVMTIVFSLLFRRNIPNYPLYYFCGNLLFAFNASATRASLHSIRKNSGIIKKIYVPKFMLCISDVCVAFTELLFSMIPLVGIVFFSGLSITWTWMFIPVILVLQFIFTLGLSLILSTYSVFFRDLDYLYGIVVTVWTYFTPIFYPISIINPNYLFIWEMNPLYLYISMFRDVVYSGILPSIETISVANAYSVVVLLIGMAVFKRNEDKFFLHI